jgi:hypothetical protein
VSGVGRSCGSSNIAECLVSDSIAWLLLLLLLLLCCVSRALRQRRCMTASVGPWWV